jgi:hypothetical protein
VLELGDVLGGHLRLPQPETRATVLRAIKDSIKFLKDWKKLLSREGQTSIANRARKIANLIAELEQEIEHLPTPLAEYLFTPLPARYTVIPVDEIRAAVTTDRAVLLQRLQQLRMDCERQEPPLHSSGPEPDREKVYCATLARNLMMKFSTRPITGSAESPYRQIASLLFEALSGNGEVDLKRACDRVLHDVKARRSVT